MKVNFAWNANSEADIAGYKIYAGTATGVYTAPGSPKDMGNVTSGYFDITTFGVTWYFALTSYNTGAQESGFSTEIVRLINAPVAMFRA